MKQLLLPCCLLLSSHCVSAQSDHLLKVYGEVRMDYQRDYRDGTAHKPNSGFKGKYLNFELDGKIVDALTWHYRQRLNKAHKDQSLFDATDWAYLAWQANSRWSVSAGKQPVNIGSFEYERTPIDMYFSSEFWYNIPCFTFGVNVSYTPNDGKDLLTAQVCESPFNTPDGDMYAYGLAWTGKHGILNTVYTANMTEYKPGKMIWYVALGHQLTFGKSRLQLDIMNRAAQGHAFLFKDVSVIAEWRHTLSKKCAVMAKMTYEANTTDSDADPCVYAGTELTRLGAGVEYYPVGNNQNVRLHANACYSYGKNSNPNGTVQPRQLMINTGLTWKVTLMKL